MVGMFLSFSSLPSMPLPLAETFSFGLFCQPFMAFGFRFLWCYLCQSDNQVRSYFRNGLWIGQALNTSTELSRKWRGSSKYLLRLAQCLLLVRFLAHRRKAVCECRQPDMPPQQVRSGSVLFQPNNLPASSQVRPNQ